MTFETRMTSEIPSILTRDDQVRQCEGLASVYYSGQPGTEYVLWRSRSGDPEAVERITPEAFESALKRRDDVLATYNHDRSTALARYPGDLQLWTDSTGLRYRFDFDMSDPDHQRVAAKLSRGTVRGSSFAFVPSKVEWKRQDGVRVCYVHDLQLRDVAVVTDPAYAATVSYARSSLSNHELDEWQRKIAALKSI